MAAERRPREGGTASDARGGPLTDRQRRALRAATARIVPSDGTPGAEEAGALAYIERSLAGDYAAQLPRYAEGLAALDANAADRHGTSFAELSPERQDEFLAELEAGGSAFFETLLTHTIEGMFGDPHWGANARGVGWELLGYPGPRPAWSAAEQGSES